MPTNRTQSRHQYPVGRYRPKGRLAVAFLILLGASCAGGTTATFPSSSALVDLGAGLTGPAGLTASKYVEDLPHMSAFAFDDQGLLWVATADYTDSGDDAVYLVPAPGATPIQVISGLHMPLGLLWYNGSLYVSSKERVDAYGGFDGSKIATTMNRRERRKVFWNLATRGAMTGRGWTRQVSGWKSRFKRSRGWTSRSKRPAPSRTPGNGSDSALISSFGPRLAALIARRTRPSRRSD